MGPIVRALAWGELFVLLPLHAFWMLYRCVPFVAENTTSALVAGAPVVLLGVMGLLSSVPRVRAAILRAEWLFHITAAAAMFLLLVYITVRDPFSPGIPISWPLCFWAVGISFVALADVALHERVRVAAGGMRLAGLVTAVAVWPVLLGLASSLDWAPYFWSASLLFHAAMAPCSRRKCTPLVAPVKSLGSVAALIEGLFIVLLMLESLLRMIFTVSVLGRAELKYMEFVGVAACPAFGIGAALAFVGARFRVALLTHALVGGVCLFAPETAAVWSVPFVLGYALPALYLASCRQGPVAYALTFSAVTAVWGFGALGFMVAGLVVVMKLGLHFAENLYGYGRISAVVLYIGWILALYAIRWWRKRRPEGSGEPLPETSRVGVGGAYAGAWVVIGVFVLCFAVSSMGPAVRFQRAGRVPVGEVSGVCHAGSSRTDEEYADLDKLGVRTMRVDFHWRHVQPAPDTWDFSGYDAYVRGAEAHGFNVVALLVFDNDAVETDPKGAERAHYIAPADLPKYLDYVRRTVSRYKGQVYAWELWNEPDIPRFWDGPIDELYELIIRTAETVREADPGAVLAGPAATSPLGAYSPAIIEGFHLRGALDLVDHPTMHTYISDPRGYYNEFYRVRNAAAKYGHPGSIWITELGDPDGGLYPWRGSREELAAHAVKAYTIATSVGIEKLLWYCYRDSSPEDLRATSIDSEGFFGLANHDGTWKPAAYAYSLFSKHCSNSEIRSDLVHVRGGLAARQLRTALYRRDHGESTLVLWFEPGLRKGAHARVSLNLGSQAISHDITSGDTKPVFDPVIDVTETPTFITFTADTPDAPIYLTAATSPGDMAWLVLALVAVVFSVWASVRRSVLEEDAAGLLPCADRSPHG